MSGILKFNSSRYRLRLENEQFAKQVPVTAMVLDAGAGSSPYHDLFAHAHYESADHLPNKNEKVPTTYVCDLRQIPVAGDRYDFIVFNQVMEHLPDPSATLAELFRVMKPGGQMIFSAPLFYEEHEAPYDFYRYTRYGVQHLFQDCGFEIERLDWLEGFFGTVGYQLRTIGNYLPYRPRDLSYGLWGIALAPCLVATRYACTIGSVCFHQLEKRIKLTVSGYPKNYVAIVRKPLNDESSTAEAVAEKFRAAS